MAEVLSYELRLHVVGRAPKLPMEADEFRSLKAAKDLVVGVLGVEESMYLVLGNFLEYEALLLREALSGLVFAPGSWSEFRGVIHEVNRLLVNVLSGCRGYVDQSKHFLSGRFGKDSGELQSFREWAAEQYDSKLGYRVMEALRNYSQHRGVAVHQLAHSHWRAGAGPGGPRRNALVPSLLPTRLAEDGRFKASVLEELLAKDEPVDLRPLVREYVSGLALIHEQLRSTLEDSTEAADSLILGAIERYDREGQAGVVGLAALKRNDKGEVVDSVALFKDVIERRKELVRRSRHVPHVVGAYTTNEPSSTP